MTRIPSVAWRRDRRLPPRGLALVAVGVVAAVALALLARSLLGPSEAERSAERFTAAWAGGDYGGMHELLTPESREAIRPRAFAFAYEQAKAMATTVTIDAGDPSEANGAVIVPLTVGTAAFGAVDGDLQLRVRDGLVEWTPNLVFPGLAVGETLSRRTRAPTRARLLAENGETLVKGDGDSRDSPLGLTASSVAGTVAPAPSREERERLFARGFPRDANVGLTGLERVFERELAGTPGGVLRAGDRRLASAPPRRAEPVRTTLDVELQEAAASGLGERAGGVAVLDVETGRVRALAGAALAGPQPPGSTFKIVTTTAALEADLVTPSERFPVKTAAVIDGFTLRNAGGEACGGTFTNSFAHSCNSVFAPLGVEVGAKRLVETAERYGLNRPTAIPSAERSTIPQPAAIESDLELGATAIGQGKVLTTPLELASIARAIAAGGEHLAPTIAADAPRPQPVRVTSRKVARTIGKLMVGVVDFGTGRRAAIRGVDVAGKTGTAELGPGVTEHAWFTAYAPARRPQLAIALMIANGGMGGEVAAPVAKTILETGLER